MKNHLTIGVYPNKDFVYNVVRDEDLQNHIDYNTTFRPGRLLYVDGKRVTNGMIRKECLEDYDNFVEQLIRTQLSDVNMCNPTIPYR